MTPAQIFPIMEGLVGTMATTAAQVAGEWQAVIPPNSSVTGLKGAWWVYSCNNAAQVVAMERTAHPTKQVYLWNGSTWVVQQ